jgi:hypothetical protein
VLREKGNVKVTPAEGSPKRWWERPLGIVALGVVVTVVGGLTVWLISRHYDKPTPSTAIEEPTPPPVHTTAPSPAIPLLKTPLPLKSKPTGPKVRIEQHGEGSGAVGGINQGPGSALSINQQGGITAGTITVSPLVLFQIWQCQTRRGSKRLISWEKAPCQESKWK